MTALTVIRLRADTEQDLIDVLPMLRWSSSVEGEPPSGWITDDHGLTFVALGPLTITPAVMAEDGETVVTPAVVDHRFHADMQIRPAHPHYSAIAAAVEPFVVTPAHPRHEFA